MKKLIVALMLMFVFTLLPAPLITNTSNYAIAATVSTATTTSSADEGVSETNWQSGPIPIFPGESQTVVMLWYYCLATLSGAFIFLTLIKSGFQYIFQSTSNPGVRASAILTVQRGFVGLIIIMLAPLFVNILITINNAFVDFCRGILEAVTNASNLGVSTTAAIGSENSFLDKLFAWPFIKINEIINYIFGLTPLGDVIFNQAPAGSIFSNNITSGQFVNTGNALADALLSLGLLGFSVYFNATYIIRRWVVIAVMAVTPIIVWIWILSDNKQVIGIWLSELIQTIFMQSFHALTFGIVFSVLAFSGGSLSYLTNDQMAFLLVGIGKYLAAFGGVACVFVLIFQAYQLILNSNEKERADAISKIRNALIGVIILGLSFMIASSVYPDNITIYSQTQIVAGTANIDIGNAHDETENNITIFYLFFALVAIMPISKMLSSIFMNLIARIGTVDETAVASSGMGMFKGLAALGLASGGALQGIKGNKSYGENLSHNNGGGAGSSTMPSAENLTPHNSNGFNAVGSGGQGATPSGRQGFNFNSSPSTGYNEGTVMDANGTYASSQNDEDPGFYVPNTPSDRQGFDLSSSPGSQDTEADPGFYIPEYDDTSIPPDSPKRLRQDQQLPSTQYNEVLNQTHSMLDKVALGANKLGVASGFAIPGAGVGAGIGVMLSGVTRAASPLVAGASLVYSAARHEEGVAHFTGRDTRAGGITQIAAASMFSPFGVGASRSISTALGAGIDSMSKRTSQPN